MEKGMSGTDCNCLTYEQRLRLLQVEFDFKSGLLAMHIENEKELGRIHRSNELSIAKANRGVRR